jgi:TatA/E family protein of Tat protein translocase
MFGLGHWEILIILFIVVLLFGSRRIPELARGLGEGIRTFKTGLHSDEDRKEIEKRPEPREETQRTT